MNIEINKDFLKEYKDDAWKGFSMRELLSIIAAAIVGIGVDAVLHLCFGLSLAAGVYIALPVAFPIILIGFYKYQGHMTVGRVLKEITYRQRTATVLYDSAEGECKEKEANLMPVVKTDKKKRITGAFGRIKKAGLFCKRDKEGSLRRKERKEKEKTAIKEDNSG